MERILIAAVFNQFHIKRVGYGGCPDIRDTPLRTSQYKLQNLVAARFSRRCTSKKKVFRSKADIPNDEVVLHCRGSSRRRLEATASLGTAADEKVKKEIIRSKQINQGGAPLISSSKRVRYKQVGYGGRPDTRNAPLSISLFSFLLYKA